MKLHRFVGIDTAMYLLRPGAKWEFTSNVGFTRWEDPRPCPSVEEVFKTIEKIRQFEESINTIFLPEQEKKIKKQLEDMQGIFDTQI